MENPLANPLDALHDRAGHGPDWAWKAVGTGAGILGGLVARKLLVRVRSNVSAHGDAPINPGDERMTWPNAVLWAAVVGVGASLGRLLAQRIVAAAWKRRTHRAVSDMPT